MTAAPLKLPRVYRARDAAGKVRAFVYSGEKRPPRAGEWYISGALPAVYRAGADLATPYHIAREVQA